MKFDLTRYMHKQLEVWRFDTLHLKAFLQLTHAKQFHISFTDWFQLSMEFLVFNVSTIKYFCERKRIFYLIFLKILQILLQNVDVYPLCRFSEDSKTFSSQWVFKLMTKKLFLVILRNSLLWIFIFIPISIDNLSKTSTFYGLLFTKN